MTLNENIESRDDEKSESDDEEEEDNQQVEIIDNLPDAKNAKAIDDIGVEDEEKSTKEVNNIEGIDLGEEEVYGHDYVKELDIEQYKHDVPERLNARPGLRRIIHPPNRLRNSSII